MATDVVQMVAVGALLGLLILYTTRLPFNRAVFEAAMDYGAVARTAEYDRDARASWAHQPEITVAPRSQGGSAGSESTDYVRSRPLTGFVFQPGDEGKVQEVLGRTLVSGSLTPDTVLIDQATASDYALRPGDRIVVTALADPGLIECQVEVGGIVRPFHERDGLNDGGVIVLGTRTCPQVQRRLPEPDYWYAFDAPTTPGDSTKWTQVTSAFSSPAAAGFILALAVIGLLLWVAVVSRVTRGLRSNLGSYASTLVSLGARPSVPGLLTASFVTILSAVGATVAVLVARAAIREVAGFYTQPIHVLWVTAVLTLAAMVPAMVLSRGLWRHEEGQS